MVNIFENKPENIIKIQIKKNMGCSGSTHMVPVTSDILSKPELVPAEHSVPKSEVIFQDLPDIVDKVIYSLKEPDSKDLKVLLKRESSSNLIQIKEDLSNADNIDLKQMPDPNTKGSTQELFERPPLDSISSSSKQSELELFEESKMSINKSSTTISVETDSLRTSSSDSEIEQALANTAFQNPPTPKPTFSELQNIAMYPINTIIKNFIKTTESFPSNAVVEEKATIIDISEKSEKITSITTNLKDPTEWEKQADMLANSQKFNPVEAMRKMKKDNYTSSISIHRPDQKPKIPRYLEDFLEISPVQSPLHSRIPSARSENSINAASSEFYIRGPVYVSKTGHDDTDKPKGIQIKKSSRNIKDSSLTVPTSVRGIPLSSPHKVRQRCAVCCDKYKQ